MGRALKTFPFCFPGGAHLKDVCPAFPIAVALNVAPLDRALRARLTLMRTRLKPVLRKLSFFRRHTLQSATAQL